MFRVASMVTRRRRRRMADSRNAKANALLAPTPRVTPDELLGIVGAPRKVAVADIRRLVATRFKLAEHEIFGSGSLARYVVLARHVAIYLARTLTPHSMTVIAKFVGGCDHTTIMHACKRVEKKMAQSDIFASEVASLRMELVGYCGQAYWGA